MNIQHIAKLIENAGGRLYLVGGAVRDEFLKDAGAGIKTCPNDEDYCITGLAGEEFEKLFPEAHSRGKSFEVYDLEGREFALARKDVKEGTGHKGFKIITGKDITIEEDLKRRDITINSMAKDVITGEIIDPFGGREDIKAKLIRATDTSFLEDPLRAYRAARFAADFEYDVHEDTIKLINILKPELNTLSKERVFVEFRKALGSKRPSIFFDVLKKAEILDVHFKEIYDLIGAQQPLQYHPEGDSYNHTIIALNNSTILTDNLEIRFAALVHDLGKGETPEELYPHHYGHAESGVEPVRNLCRRIGVPNRWRKAGVVSSAEHMKRWHFL
ncbi:MAG: HD domain-containing protein [Firmicutes bacterium]|nr:HD domain-containing protein [Bacillota bacterium]